MTEMTTTVGAIPAFDLSLRVLAARQHAGMDQTELAERSGVSRGTISAAERGLRKPTRGNLALIAFATGVDAKWLITGSTTTAPSPDGEGAVSGECARRDSNPQPSGSEPQAADQRGKVLPLPGRSEPAPFPAVA